MGGRPPESRAREHFKRRLFAPAERLYQVSGSFENNYTVLQSGFRRHVLRLLSLSSRGDTGDTCIWSWKFLRPRTVVDPHSSGP